MGSVSTVCTRFSRNIHKLCPRKRVSELFSLVEPLLPPPPPPKPHNNKKALDTYEDLDQTIGVDGYTLTAVVDVLRRLGDWRRALPLLDRLVDLGVSANQGLRTSVNAVLSAMGPDNYRRARRLEAKAAAEWGVDGDIVTYGTLLLLASARLPSPALLSCSGAGTAPAVVVDDDDSWGEVASSCVGGSRSDGGAVVGVKERGEGEHTEEEDGKWETVKILRAAVAAKAVPSEACLDMVVFSLARGGVWEEATAFVEAIEQAGLAVSRHQVGICLLFRVCLSLVVSLCTPGCLLVVLNIGIPLYLEVLTSFFGGNTIEYALVYCLLTAVTMSS